MSEQFKWGRRSLDNLSTVHPRLRAVADRALQLSPTDFVVTDGLRGKEDQDRAVAEKRSKTPFPKSNHNKTSDPSWVGDRYKASDALDFMPLPLGYKAPASVWKGIATAFEQAGRELGIKVRWGGDWNMDGDKTLNDSWDMPHVELRWSK